MTDPFPHTFYHAISQTRLKDAIAQDHLPGHSRLHHDSSGKLRGMWMSDTLALILDANHGLEQSDEIIGELPLPSGEILKVKKPIPPIILQIEGLDEGRILPHIIDPHQFFYDGNLDWDKITKLLVTDKWTEGEAVAKELAQKLKTEGKTNPEVETFDPMDIPKHFEFKKEVNINSPRLIDNENTRK